MKIDTAYIDEFVKGMNDGARNADDKKRAAYNAGSKRRNADEHGYQATT